MMGFNRLDELQNLKTVECLLPYVDQFVYVDGSEGQDGTANWLLYHYPQNSPIVVIPNKWSDNFPEQRNVYLRYVEEIMTDDFDNWIIVADTDEVFSPLLSKNIRNIIQYTIHNTYNDKLLVRCKSVTIKGNETIYENMDDFYKPLIFRMYKRTRYWADTSSVTDNKTALHEALTCSGKYIWRPIKLDDQNGKLYYSHVKQENIIWERGLRNFVVFGGGPNLGDKQPLWRPFRKMLSKYLGNDYTSFDVIQYFKKGNIPQEIKDWIILHRNEDGYDGSSEVRECFLSYFVLYHPEELPIELQSEYIHLL